MRFLLGMAALSVIYSSPAQAGLEICNQTDLTASVSIGYQRDNTWTSEGWWNIAPNDCATVVEGDLRQRYYYWHATNDLGVFIAEEYTFCTTPDIFTIKDDKNCGARGYEQTQFTEIDTGDAKRFVVNLELLDAPGHYGNPSPAIPWAVDGWPSQGGDLIKDLAGFYRSREDPDLFINITGRLLTHNGVNGVTAQANILRLVECHGYEKNALIEVNYDAADEECWEILQVDWDGFTYRTIPDNSVHRMLRTQ